MRISLQGRINLWSLGTLVGEGAPGGKSWTSCQAGAWELESGALFTRPTFDHPQWLIEWACNIILSLSARHSVYSENSEDQGSRFKNLNFSQILIRSLS